MTLQRQPTATRSASDRLNMESSRLLCDDGHSASCPAGAGKTQASRGVDGWTAASLDAASRMRQEYRPPNRTWEVAGISLHGSSANLCPKTPFALTMPRRIPRSDTNVAQLAEF